MATDTVGPGSGTGLTTYPLGHLGQASQPLQVLGFVILK